CVVRTRMNDSGGESSGNYGLVGMEGGCTRWMLPLLLFTLSTTIKMFPRGALQTMRVFTRFVANSCPATTRRVDIIRRKNKYMQGVMRYMVASIVIMMICNSTYGQQALQRILWEKGKGEYESYRIPSIIVTTNGTILAFAEGRKKPGDAGDIDLLLRRSFDNGKTWTDPQVVWDDGDNTCGNPNPVVDQETGRIFLFSTWNLGRDTEKEIITKTSDDTRRPYVMYSDDDGEIWSEPRNLTDCCKESSWGWYATGP